MTDAGSIAASVISIAGERRRLLLPIRDGIGDLADCVVLVGTGLQIWDAMRRGDSVAAVATRIATGQTIALRDAERDTHAFLGDLAQRGLSPRGDAAGGRAAIDRSQAIDEQTNEQTNEQSNNSSDLRGDEPGAITDASAEDVETLARSVLGGGHRLRFVAHGDSMRPEIADGTTIEVEPMSFVDARVGDAVLHRAGANRLVAHRVVRKARGRLVTRGDSAGRLDTVTPEDFLGRVTATVDRNGARRPISRARRLSSFATGWPRRLGRLAKRPAGYGIGLGCRLLRGMERRASAWLRRLEVLRAASLSSTEKHDQRRRLYAGKAVQDFTALDENVQAGFTLIEEMIFLRHEIAPGRALVLGCGPGRECFALAERGFAVTGIDTEPAMLERARAGAAKRGLDITFHAGAADAFDLEGPPFDVVVVFSGLYNMILPRRRRLATLRACREHLAPGGRVLLTFLSGYAPPGGARPTASRSPLQVLNPEHEAGDRFLLNEAVHIFPHADDLCDEIDDAGLDVEVLFRDQRAYDRGSGRVRGYVVLTARR